MWKKRSSFINRVTSGMMACMLTAATVLSPFTSLPTYAKQSILDLSYRGVEKHDAEIYILSENSGFEPGSDIELKLFIENNTDQILTKGGLSFRDKSDSLENEKFVYDEEENPEIEINEKGSMTNITLEPGEIFEVSFTATVENSLELTNKRTVGFFFGSEKEENGTVSRNVEFDFTTGLVTLLPVEFENEIDEFAAGTTGSMKMWLSVDDPERYINIPEGGLETDSNAEEKVESDSNAEEIVESGSNAEEAIESDSNAEEAVESDSNAEEAVESASNAEDEDEDEDDSDDEDLLTIDKVMYSIETYGVEFENVMISDATVTDYLDGIITTIDFDIKEETPAGTYFGKAEAAVRIDGKTFRAEQGFCVTVTEALTEEQLAEVQRVIELIDKLPEPEAVWKKSQEYYNAEDYEGYDAYAKSIAELAWPAYYAYNALSKPQKALVTNYYKLEQTAWLWSAVTLENTADYIVLSGEELYQLLGNPNAAATISEVRPDGTIRLTAGTRETSSGTTVGDPWVYINFNKAAGSIEGELKKLQSGSLDRSKFVVLVTYLRAEETPDIQKMRLYPVADPNCGPTSDKYSKNVNITSEYYDYAIFDFSSLDATEFPQIARFRFDFVDTADPAIDGYTIDIESIGFFKSTAAAEEYVKNNRPDAAREGDIKTSKGDGAIKFQLFDYSKYIDKVRKTDSEEWRTLSQYFNFRSSSEMEGKYGKHQRYVGTGDSKGMYRNEAYDEDGFTDNHATVERNLKDNYPVLDLTRNAKGESRENVPEVSSDNRSLAHLFGKPDSAGTVNTFNPTNTILSYNEETRTYSYNSAENAVDYNRGTNEFYVRNYNERNSSTASYFVASVDTNGNVTWKPYSEEYYDFIPFNYTKGNEFDVDEIPSNIDKFDVNYWFGMRMDVDFYQAKDGKLNSEDMIFKFSGDDDVWVFVDDKLALDLGGTHGSVDGTINFATGEIEQYLNWNGTNKKESYKALCQEIKNLEDIGESNMSDEQKTALESKKKEKENFQGYYATTLYDAFYNAYKDSGKSDAEAKAACAEIFVKDGDNYRFNDFSKHKLSFFYMERGASVANCKIEFNLPTVPENSLTVTKKVEDDGDFIPDETEYKFKVLAVDSDGNLGDPIIEEGAEYTILSAGENESKTGTVGEGGVFKLKAGEAVQFENLLDEDGAEKYQVVEILENEEQTEKPAASGMGTVSEVNWDYKMYYKEVEVESNSNAAENITYTPSTEESYKGIYSTGTFSTADTPSVVFTNKVADADLTIRKEITNVTKDTKKSFQFKLQMKNKNLYGKEYEIESGSNAIDSTADGSAETKKIKFDEATGIAYVHVEVNNSVTIKGLPLGAEIEIEEISYNGYIPSWTIGSANGGDEANVGGIVSASADGTEKVPNNEITVGPKKTISIEPGTKTITVICKNTPGTRLPDTGGGGTAPYSVGGSLLMLLAVGYLLLNERKNSRREMSPI